MVFWGCAAGAPRIVDRGTGPNAPRKSVHMSISRHGRETGPPRGAEARATVRSSSSFARTPMRCSNGHEHGTCRVPDCRRHERTESRTPSRCSSREGHRRSRVRRHPARPRAIRTSGRELPNLDHGSRFLAENLFVRHGGNVEKSADAMGLDASLRQPRSPVEGTSTVPPLVTGTDVPSRAHRSAPADRSAS